MTHCRTTTSKKAMVILSRTSVDLLLLVIFVMPCATTLYRHNRQNVFEPPHQVEEESNRAQRSSSSKNYYYSKQLRLWNESWPMVVKQKHELITKYGSAATADQPYTLSQSCFDDLQLLVYGLSVLDDWALESEFSHRHFMISISNCLLQI